jgi:putative proteasome-type protease
MTYCVGMRLDRGLVLMSDSRTNSGVDNVSTFRKMFHWSVPGERQIAIMTAGNLATTQTVISLIEERTKALSERRPSLLEAPTMFQVATIVGTLLRDTITACGRNLDGQADGGPLSPPANTFTASMIVAGQIKGSGPRLFMVYPEGNFIEASGDTPFFQIGETKYGRPILVRGYDPAMRFEEAVKLLMVSFDSTLAANLSVGMPFDLMVMERDRFEPLHRRRIAADDPYFRTISTGWSVALRDAFHALPDYSLDEPAQD